MKNYKLIILFFVIGVAICNLALAADCDPTRPTAELCNPIRNVSDLPGLLKMMMGSFGVLLGGSAVVMMVFSGIQLVISQGDSEKVERGKSSLTWVVAGFVLAILSFVIIVAAQQFLGVDTTNLDQRTSPEAVSIFNPFGQNDNSTIGSLLFRVTKNILSIAGIIAIVMLMIAGFKYITSAGNDEQAEQGKEGIKWAVTGIIVIFLAYVIISAVAAFFNR